MKLFRGVGKAVNTAGGGVARGAVRLSGHLIGKKFPKTGEYVKDVGESVIRSSQTVIGNTAHFADGSAEALAGAISKDKARMHEGWSDIKASSVNTAKGIGNGLVFTGKSVGQTVQGAVRKNEAQFVGGLKNVGKAGAVALVGIGVLDGLVDADTASAEELETRNASLDESAHVVTGVDFESKTVVLADGGTASGVFPVFDSAFDARLPEDTYLMADSVHIGIANMQLYEAIQANPGMADDLGFTDSDVENLLTPVTPEGFDWHHNEEPGKLQLVDEETHATTGHTGGRSIWGGGTESR